MVINFVVYDPATGSLIKSVTINASEADAEGLVALNTPKGKENLMVTASALPRTNLNAWNVSAGKLSRSA